MSGSPFWPDPLGVPEPPDPGAPADEDAPVEPVEPDRVDAELAGVEPAESTGGVQVGPDSEPVLESAPGEPAGGGVQVEPVVPVEQVEPVEPVEQAGPFERVAPAGSVPRTVPGDPVGAVDRLVSVEPAPVEQVRPEFVSPTGGVPERAEVGAGPGLPGFAPPVEAATPAVVPVPADDGSWMKPGTGMFTPPGVGVRQRGRTRRRPVWRPGWAVLVAWLPLTLGIFLVLWGLRGVVLDLSYRGEKFDGLGAAIGGIVAAFGAAAVLPAALFVWRGGVRTFAVTVCIPIVYAAVALFIVW